VAGRRVLIIEGSPRRAGNSSTLAAEVAAGAGEAGAFVERVVIHDMDVSPCSACDACQDALADDCVIDDDMAPLYPKLRSADALVVATPVYWFSVSAQTKLFLDRCTPLSMFRDDPRPGGSAWTVESDLAGTEVGLLLTFGDRDVLRSGAVDALRTLQDGFACMGATLVGMVYGRANAAGEIAADREVMNEARALGRRLGVGPG